MSSYWTGLQTSGCPRILQKSENHLKKNLILVLNTFLKGLRFVRTSFCSINTFSQEEMILCFSLWVRGSERKWEEVRGLFPWAWDLKRIEPPRWEEKLQNISKCVFIAERWSWTGIIKRVIDTLKLFFLWPRHRPLRLSEHPAVRNKNNGNQLRQSQTSKFLIKASVSVHRRLEESQKSQLTHKNGDLTSHLFPVLVSVTELLFLQRLHQQTTFNTATNQSTDTWANITASTLYLSFFTVSHLRIKKLHFTNVCVTNSN